MSTNLQLAEAIERYVNGEMTGDELARFEQYRKDNAEVDLKITEHKYFAGLLKQYRERVALEAKLNAIHDEIDVHALVEEMTVHPSGIVRMWRNHHSKISVAASIAMFVVVGAMFFTGYFTNKNQPHYQELRGEIGKLRTEVRDQKRGQNALAVEIRKRPKMTTPSNYKGSGLALSTNGYIVTNAHVVGGRFDSLYVQDASGSSYKAKLVYSEPLYDIAILKIIDKSFSELPALPYNFKRNKSEVGEEVYAIGYSEGDSPVFDKGYVSSINGYLSDSSEYRVSIPLNPGNSGGPLVNAKGSIIGIVSGKQTQVVGASYAKKSGYLYKALRNVPADSLSGKLTLNNKNTLAKLDPVKQYKKLQNYVFMVKVY
ncbi:S1C family serine protease [Mucilaginibacter myungsuensis]|uniref:Trypsin-like peptidase domain-containing protein n=1 Tax=Mucilaginibacter myungsuensis TaxID=649104 RepID=A0A929KUD1_9SPHI|nr:serine protease [Mucilaginibacter myungsuensis]MBE9660947.1 trypsin-like peptidase domain-containing protein [Mucilaginibacter myungsuensis]MDN3600993.1 serine protease [Mucilaginibacter myungsuensis]